MKTLGIDTCVMLRLLVGEPAAQAEKARGFLETSYNQGVRVTACDLSVAEAYHALIHYYEVPKPKAICALREFLESPLIQNTGHAPAVLAEYKGTGAGFVDRLIRMELLAAASEVVTFDRSFARMDNVRGL